jgi:hypothetical protein
MKAFGLLIVHLLFTFPIQCQECHLFDSSSINEGNHWGVSQSVAEERLHQMRSENVDCEGEDCVLLKFLYVKGVLSSFPSKSRKEWLENIIDPAKCESDELTKQFSEAKERLRSIVAPEGDMITSSEIPESVQTFDEAMHRLQNWKKTESDDIIHIFHLHDDKIQGRDVLVQRVLKSGLSYLHAPAVLSYYLVSRHNFTGSVNMINIALHVAGSFDGRALYEHIFGDKGGSSIRHLKHFLAPGSNYKVWNIENIGIHTFKIYGPALISGFEVFDDFMTEDKLHYEGLPHGKSKGFHAMVLLGMMKTKGRKTFILQNWWRKKQFISVTEEYLKASSPSIYFVTTPQLSIPACFSTHSFKYAETCLLDRPERLLEEHFQVS